MARCSYLKSLVNRRYEWDACWRIIGFGFGSDPKETQS